MTLDQAIKVAYSPNRFGQAECQEAAKNLKHKHGIEESRDPLLKHPPYSNYLRLADQITKDLKRRNAS